MLKWIDGFYLYLKWTFFRSEEDLHEHQLAILSVLSTKPNHWWYRQEIVEASNGTVKPYWFFSIVHSLEDKGLVLAQQEPRYLHKRRYLRSIFKITDKGIRVRAEEGAKERNLLPSELLEPQAQPVTA